MARQEYLLSPLKRKMRATTIWQAQLVSLGTKFNKNRVPNSKRGRRRASQSKKMTMNLTLAELKWISLRREPGIFL